MRNHRKQWGAALLALVVYSPIWAQTSLSLSDVEMRPRSQVSNRTSRSATSKITTIPRDQSAFGSKSRRPEFSRGSVEAPISGLPAVSTISTVPRDESIIGRATRMSHQDSAIGSAVDGEYLPDVPPVPLVPRDNAVPSPFGGPSVVSGGFRNEFAGAVCGPDVKCERMWVKGELLTWWLNGAETPALLAMSDPNTVRAESAILGLPTTTVLVGGDDIGDRIRLGTRISVGGWIGKQHALEGYWLYLGDDDSGDYTATSVLGDPILGRPFYNARDAVEDAHLTGFPNLVDGTVNIASDSELQSAGLNLRQVVSEGCNGRLDLIGGYRYLHFRDSITITENLVDREVGGLFVDNSTIYLQDRFAAENDWHGGEIGAAATFDKGRLTFDVLTKLGLGGIRRSSDIRGVTTVTTPMNVSATSNSGLLAANTNSGATRDYDFSMIPELNLNMRLQLNDNLSIGAGYSLLFVTRVLRAGDMIDRNLNPDQSPIQGGGAGMVNPPLPSALLDDSTLRAQGFTFNAELHF